MIVHRCVFALCSVGIGGRGCVGVCVCVCMRACMCVCVLVCAARVCVCVCDPRAMYLVDAAPGVHECMQLCMWAMCLVGGEWWLVCCMDQQQENACMR